MLKYVERSFYNEWVSFEYKRKTYTRDLTDVIDNGKQCFGYFEFNNKKYQLVIFVNPYDVHILELI
ncbi:hypothetical protein IJ22_18900 [Paenibacillus naphthalenovorans]|uniref:Uncharacterized protein n=1 Tax=Paenibacillus naphthalenovorans TaxID=162209 RepID=A0A0U2U7V3_9BACL|nr:hypothetical protein IJ22_18900 [Paenibacillus naphthalenovorans]